VRVFAALPLPPRTAREVSETLPGLRRAGANLKIASVDGLHITLHFFGEIEEEAVAALCRAMDDPRLARLPIPAVLGPLGRFPPSGIPNVLFRRMDAGGPEVAAYRELFLAVIAPLGYRPESKPFTAHVTVARNRGGRVDLTEVAEAAPLTFAFGECVLFRSILERTGARYEALRRIPFREVTP
jgi:RNA 2',3'-cyclic 3'-phosphodiesterase